MPARPLTTRLPLLLLVAALVPLAARDARADRRLSLDEALRLARHNNRDLAAARARLAAAAVGIEQARVALMPTLSVQGKYAHNYKTIQLDPRSFGASPTQLAQPTSGLATAIAQSTTDAPLKFGVNLFNDQFQQQVATAQAQYDAAKPIIISPGEQLDFSATAMLPLIVPAAWSAQTAAKESYRASQSDFRVTETQLLVLTAQAWYAAAGGDEIVAARKHSIEVAQRTADLARKRFAAGAVTRVETTRAALAVLRAEQSLREATEQRDNVYAQLATILLEREPFVVAPPDDSTLSPLAIDAPEALVSRALELRPEFASFQANLKASSANLRAARWRWAPTVSAFGNVRAFNYSGFGGDNYAWAAGAQLDWQLYDGGARDAQRHLVEAQARDLELREEQLRDTVSDEVRAARRAVDTRRHALETARSSVGLSQETLELTRVQYEAGTALQLDLLSAQDGLIVAEVTLAQSRFDLALADVALRRATGAFPEPAGAPDRAAR